MLHDKNRLRFYYPVILTLLGGAAYEFFSKMAVLRENIGDYSSILYTAFITFALVGAVVAAIGLIELARFVTQFLNTVTKQHES